MIRLVVQVTAAFDADTGTAYQIAIRKQINQQEFI